jgi:hypothetical protein
MRAKEGEVEGRKPGPPANDGIETYRAEIREG